VSETGLTRREALKRGALIAGAAWAIPVVQAVGLRPAYAQTTSSPTDCTTYCVRWNNQSRIWQEMPDGQLRCPSGALDDVPPCFDGFVPQADLGTGSLTFTFPDSCKFEFGDPSPDPLAGAYAGYVKCGGQGYLIRLADVIGDSTLTVQPCDGNAIQQVDLIIQCCCG